MMVAKRQGFLFLSGLFLSLSLQAKSLSSIDLPKNCITKKIFPCALRAVKGMLKFEQGSESYQLGEFGSIRFTGPGQFQLLSGSLWIEKSQNLRLVVNPALTMNINGEFFLEKQKNSILLVRNLNGSVSFTSAFLFKSESLPIGFENWYGTLTTQKEIHRGVLRPIEVLSFLKAWSPVAGLSAAETQKRVQFFKESWSENVESAANFYQEVVERRLASQEEQDQRIARRRQAELEEKKRLRQLYRQKAGFDY